MKSRFKLVVLIFTLLIISGCSNNPETIDIPTELPEITEIAIELTEPIGIATEEPTEIPIENFPKEIIIWVDEYIPSEMFSFIPSIENHRIAESKDEAVLYIEIGDENKIAELVFVLVAPFPTITDTIEFNVLQKVWSGTPQPDYGLEKIIIPENYYEILTILLGEMDSETVMVMSESEILDFAWGNENTWAIMLFDDLEPKWKVIEINGESPIRNEFILDLYPLNFPISFSDEGDLIVDEMELIISNIPAKFIRDENLLTTVVLTGVTALTRGTAWEMEELGILYPAEFIGDLLRSADITHISNEVPFVENCPEPSRFQEGYVFCSDPNYIELLDVIGTDVVELTGDHFGDYSSQDVLSTFEMYEERGWPYYGAGADIESGRQAITIEHNGNKIAFIGCNGKGNNYTPTNWGQPGSVECDYEWLETEVKRLKEEDYLVIFTFQHEEKQDTDSLQFYPLYADFRHMAESGADIVSGSQAHIPLEMEFSNDNLIMYGLGNIFFDLVNGSEHMDEGLIARHVFYNNRHISTEIFTIKFISYSKPRFMNEQERIDLLEELFEASGW